MKKTNFKFILFFVFIFFAIFSVFVTRSSSEFIFACYNLGVNINKSKEANAMILGNYYIENCIKTEEECQKLYGQKEEKEKNESQNISENIDAEKLKKVQFEVNYKGKKFAFKDSDFKIELTPVQKKYYHDRKLIQTLKRNGFSGEEALCYVFPEVQFILKSLSKIFDEPETSDEVLVKRNKCQLQFVDGNHGKCVNRYKFFDDCIKQLNDNKTKLKIELEILDYKKQASAKELFCEKSGFATNYASSSDSRKNNIKVALSAFDGLIIDEGEVFSFNEITGERNEKSGYQQAKIIKNGTFILGYGGGVCQVSTTLYNACLLAGLEIIESTSHSLPVSYVEPSFDAMVSYGSSDLKIRNNSGGQIIITTSNENNMCRFKIFGLKNKYKITRQSEKVSIIPASPDIIETEISNYGDYDLEIGEEKRLSYPKDGFVSRGYLNYYDEKGNLVERKQFRENRYNPTRGVILKREK